MFVTLLLLMVCLPSLVVAQEATTSIGGDAWYKIITGIIAIPAALLGLLVTINMIKKMTLESKKLELEIREKEEKATETISTEVAVNLIRPLGEGQRGMLLIVRFVILELALRLWNVVPSAVSYITGVIPTTALLIFGDEFYENFEPTSGAGLAMMIIPQLISLLFSIVYWVIIFGFGWPLFRDTCHYLNIPIKSLLEIPTLGRHNKNKPNKSNSSDAKKWRG